VKKCSECNRVYSQSVLVCEFCREALEDSTYSRICLAGMAVALGWQGLLYLTNLSRESFWSEAFINATVFLILIYCAVKLLDKVREPERPVLREIESVLSGRLYRLAFLALLVYLAFNIGLPLFIVGSAISGIEEPGHGFTHIYGQYQSIRRVVLFGAPLLTVILLLQKQGLRFFDFRQPNSSIQIRSTAEESPNSVFILQEPYSQVLPKLAATLSRLGFAPGADPTTGRLWTNRIRCTSDHCKSSPCFDRQRIGDEHDWSRIVSLDIELRSADNEDSTMMTIRPEFCMMLDEAESVTTFPCRSTGRIEATIFEAMRRCDEESKPQASPQSA